MIFYGASGHGKVVIEAWEAGGGKVTAVVDDNATIRSILSHPVSGQYQPALYTGTSLVVSIGNNMIRKKVAAKVEHDFGTVIHPHVSVSPSAKFADGIVMMAGGVVNAGTQIGSHVIINTHAVIDHDCVIGDFVHVAPGTTVCGGVSIGEGTLVGAGAVVIQNKKIGKWAIIGAGSTIVSDVPDFALIMGTPGKIIRYLQPS